MDDFERELHQACERRPAPPSLKRRIMLERESRHTRRMNRRVVWWERIAASIVLAGALSGILAWRHAQEVRKGEEARREVLTALRITSHALNEMNARLAAHNRADNE